MTYNLVFLKFNNYFNRRIKRFNTLKEYTTNRDYYIESITRNIDYNDGITIKITVNRNITLNSLGYNYVLALDDSNDTIESRWYILEERQTRQGQWVYTLRRDLVADFWDAFMQSTIYVERGKVCRNIASINGINPLVFNREDFTANQIKKEEHLLKDKSKCKWLIGYLNKKAYETDKTFSAYLNKAAQPDFTVRSLGSSDILSKFVNHNRSYPLTTYFKACVLFYEQKVAPRYRRYTISKTGVTYQDIPQSEYTGSITCPTYPTVVQPDKTRWIEIDEFTQKYYPNNCTKEEYLEAIALKNKKLYVQDVDKYYEINVSIEQEEHTFTQQVSPDYNATWYEAIKDSMLNCKIEREISENFKVSVDFSPTIRMELKEIFNEVYNTAIHPDDMNKTINEAYDAFAIPVLEDDYYFYTRDDSGVEQLNFGSNDYNSAFVMAQEILDVKEEALDLQLVPYCPLPLDWVYEIPPNAQTGAGKIQFRIPDGTQHINWTLIANAAAVPKNVIFFLSRTEFNTIIPFNDPTDYSSIEKIKECNQLDTWRICSGDYSSVFEFNPARNESVTYFEVDCKYKPYQPYIHVAPNFGGLYGNDYNDTRGLVCSNTNYSVSRLTDAWESYERTNINYMNSFNRQIEHMDVQRQYQRIGEGVNMISGTMSGTASGAMTGFMMGGGNPLAAAAGAAIGGAASLAGGIADVYLSEQMYRENKKYTVDQFNYSLKNIRALPSTLVATGAQNPNNKVYPMLEIYKCSDIEREAYRQKLKYNGWSIGVITSDVSEYIDPQDDTYFKGQVIYTPIEGASHELSEFATEIAKGIIIERSTG